MRVSNRANEASLQSNWGESLQYVNVMSLYPYICKYFKFPVGHPVIHVEDACCDKELMSQKRYSGTAGFPPTPTLRDDLLETPKCTIRDALVETPISEIKDEEEDIGLEGCSGNLTAIWPVRT